MAGLEIEKRQEGAGDPFTNVAVRRPPRPPDPRWKKLLKNGLQGLGAAVLLAFGTVGPRAPRPPSFLQAGGAPNPPAGARSGGRPGHEPAPRPARELPPPGRD